MTPAEGKHIFMADRGQRSQKQDVTPGFPRWFGGGAAAPPVGPQKQQVSWSPQVRPCGAAVRKRLRWRDGLGAALLRVTGAHLGGVRWRRPGRPASVLTAARAPPGAAERLLITVWSSTDTPPLLPKPPRGGVHRPQASEAPPPTLTQPLNHFGSR